MSTGAIIGAFLVFAAFAFTIMGAREAGAFFALAAGLVLLDAYWAARDDQPSPRDDARRRNRQ